MNKGYVRQEINRLENIHNPFCNDYSNLTDEQKENFTCDDLKKKDDILPKCEDQKLVEDYYKRYVKQCNYDPINDKKNHWKKRLDAFFLGVDNKDRQKEVLFFETILNLMKEVDNEEDIIKYTTKAREYKEFLYNKYEKEVTEYYNKIINNPIERQLKDLQLKKTNSSSPIEKDFYREYISLLENEKIVKILDEKQREIEKLKEEIKESDTQHVEFLENSLSEKENEFQKHLTDLQKSYQQQSDDLRRKLNESQYDTEQQKAHMENQQRKIEEKLQQLLQLLQQKDTQIVELKKEIEVIDERENKRKICNEKFKDKIKCRFINTYTDKLNQRDFLLGDLKNLDNLDCQEFVEDYKQFIINKKIKCDSEIAIQKLKHENQKNLEKIQEEQQKNLELLQRLQNQEQQFQKNIDQLNNDIFILSSSRVDKHDDEKIMQIESEIENVRREKERISQEKETIANRNEILLQKLEEQTKIAQEQLSSLKTSNQKSAELKKKLINTEELLEASRITLLNARMQHAQQLAEQQKAVEKSHEQSVHNAELLRKKIDELESLGHPNEQQIISLNNQLKEFQDDALKKEHEFQVLQGKMDEMAMKIEKCKELNIMKDCQQILNLNEQEYEHCGIQMKKEMCKKVSNLESEKQQLQTHLETQQTEMKQQEEEFERQKKELEIVKQQNLQKEQEIQEIRRQLTQKLEKENISQVELSDIQLKLEEVNIANTELQREKQQIETVRQELLATHQQHLDEMQSNLQDQIQQLQKINEENNGKYQIELSILKTQIGEANKSMLEAVEEGKRNTELYEEEKRNTNLNAMKSAEREQKLIARIKDLESSLETTQKRIKNEITAKEEFIKKCQELNKMDCKNIIELNEEEYKNCGIQNRKNLCKKLLEQDEMLKIQQTNFEKQKNELEDIKRKNKKRENEIEQFQNDLTRKLSQPLSEQELSNIKNQLAELKVSKDQATLEKQKLEEEQKKLQEHYQLELQKLQARLETEVNELKSSEEKNEEYKTELKKVQDLLEEVNVKSQEAETSYLRMMAEQENNLKQAIDREKEKSKQLEELQNQLNKSGENQVQVNILETEKQKAEQAKNSLINESR